MSSSSLLSLLVTVRRCLVSVTALCFVATVMVALTDWLASLGLLLRVVSIFPKLLEKLLVDTSCSGTHDAEFPSVCLSATSPLFFV